VAIYRPFLGCDLLLDSGKWRFHVEKWSHVGILKEEEEEEEGKMHFNLMVPGPTRMAPFFLIGYLKITLSLPAKMLTKHLEFGNGD
jgi:hypothetical protein